MSGEKDSEFLNWNNTNILANLLQAEDHLCLVIDHITPEHGACVLKHLTVVIGECMEASKHCVLAQPDLCGFYREFAQKVYEVKRGFEDNGMGPDSLAKVRELRKEFESRIGPYDTGKCETGFCKFEAPGKTQSEAQQDKKKLNCFVKNGKLTCVDQAWDEAEGTSPGEKLKNAWDVLKERG